MPYETAFVLSGYGLGWGSGLGLPPDRRRDLYRLYLQILTSFSDYMKGHEYFTTENYAQAARIYGTLQVFVNDPQLDQEEQFQAKTTLASMNNAWEAYLNLSRFGVNPLDPTSNIFTDHYNRARLHLDEALILLGVRAKRLVALIEGTPEAEADVRAEVQAGIDKLQPPKVLPDYMAFLNNMNKWSKALTDPKVLFGIGAALIGYVWWTMSGAYRS
jgi:hypothetical protein